MNIFVGLNIILSLLSCTLGVPSLAIIFIFLSAMGVYKTSKLGSGCYSRISIVS